MFKLSEMTKEEKIGVLITVVYILYMIGDAFSDLSRYGAHSMGGIRGEHIFSALSGFITSMIIPIIGWGGYYIFFKKK